MTTISKLKDATEKGVAIKKISFMEELENLIFKTSIYNIFEDLNNINENKWAHPSIPIVAFLYKQTGIPYFIFKEQNFLATTETERFTINRVEIAEMAKEESKKYEELDEYHSYLTLLKAFLCYRFNYDLKIGMQRITDLLLQKNKQYGNAVLKPIRCFSKEISIKEVIKSRLDEKFARLINASEDNEDAYIDIIGYLIFLCIAIKENK